MFKNPTVSNLSEKIAAEIKEKKIEPTPQWPFLLKNYFVWIFFAFSVLVGAVAFCVILDIFSDNDWDVYGFAITNPIERFVATIPLVWLAVLGLFLVLAFYNYKHTRTGYRAETYYILGLSIVASIIIGVFFHFNFGLGGKVDAFLAKRLAFYRKVISACNHREVWTHPEKGLLGGAVMSVSVPERFSLEDFQGSVWQMQVDPHAHIRGKSMIDENDELKVIGEQTGENSFRVFEIRHWRPDCMEKKREE